MNNQTTTNDWRKLLIFFAVLVLCGGISRLDNYIKFPNDWFEFSILSVFFISYIPVYVVKVIRKCKQLKFTHYLLLTSAIVALCGGCVSLWYDKLIGIDFFLGACLFNVLMLVFYGGYIIWLAVKKKTISSDVFIMVAYTIPIGFFPFLVNSAIHL